MNQVMPVAQNRGIFVRMMLIADTGTYEQQYKRPWRSNVDNELIQDVHDRVAQTKEAITPSAMAGILSADQNFLAPQMQPESAIAIPGGWSNNRFRWTAVIENIDAIGNSSFEIVTGSTDHRGLSHVGSLDPNMVFYINNSLSMRSTVGYTPMGQQTMFGVADNSHILANYDYQGLRGNVDYRIRPIDMYSLIDRNNMDPAELAECRDTRAHSNGVAVKSRRTNTVGAAYMSSILEGYKNAQAAAQFGQATTHILDQARNNTQESSLTQDLFIKQISRIRGQSGSTFFTWNDLVHLDPNVKSDQVTTVVAKAGIAGVQQLVDPSLHQAGQGADWGQSNRMTQVAAILGNAIPSLMMNLAIAKLDMWSTNREGGRPKTVITNYNDFPAMCGARLDFTAQLNQLVRDVDQLVIPDISFNGQVDYAFKIKVDLVGETIIDLALNGAQQSTRYAIPTFADAMLTPLVTGQEQLSSKLANDFWNVLRNVVPDYSETDPQTTLIANSFSNF